MTNEELRKMTDEELVTELMNVTDDFEPLENADFESAGITDVKMAVFSEEEIDVWFWYLKYGMSTLKQFFAGDPVSDMYPFIKELKRRYEEANVKA